MEILEIIKTLLDGLMHFMGAIFLVTANMIRILGPLAWAVLVFFVLPYSIIKVIFRLTFGFNTRQKSIDYKTFSMATGTVPVRPELPDSADPVVWGEERAIEQHRKWTWEENRWRRDHNFELLEDVTEE